MDNRSDDVINRLNSLIEAIKANNPDKETQDYLCDFVRDQLDAPSQYYNSVINGAIASRIAYATKEGDDLRETIQNLDFNRRSKHIALVNAINSLNRLCGKYSLEPMFQTPRELDPEKVEDREVAADIAYAFTSKVFLDEMDKSGYFIESARHTDIDGKLSRMIEDRKSFSSGDLDERIAKAKEQSTEKGKDNAATRTTRGDCEER